MPIPNTETTQINKTKMQMSETSAFFIISEMGNYFAPFRIRTAFAVLNTSFKSSPKLRVFMYLTSPSTHSSNFVSLLPSV